MLASGFPRWFCRSWEALGSALLQIALFDLARFALTGTWDGFHLG